MAHAPRWSIIVAGLLTFFATAPSFAQAPANDAGQIIDFSRDVVPVLIKSCLECHGPKDAKNDFRVDDQESLMGYIEPGDAASSSLWTDYLISHDDDQLMPPRAKGGPLSPVDLAIIRVWIDEGAVWPEGAVMASASPDAEPVQVVEVPPAVDASLTNRLWAFQGYFHPATVHFPIALLSVSALFVVLGWVRPGFGCDIAFYCLVLGAVSCVFAAAMGWSFAEQRGYGSWTKDGGEVFNHRWAGIVVTLLSVLLAGLAIWARRKNAKKLTVIWKVGLCAAAALVGLVGHQGGELTYGEELYADAFRHLTGTTEVPVKITEE